MSFDSSPPLPAPTFRRASSLPARPLVELSDSFNFLPPRKHLPDSPELIKPSSKPTQRLIPTPPSPPTSLQTIRLEDLKRRKRSMARPWSSSEDDLLSQLCLASETHNWAEIASKKFPFRSARSVETRWNKELKAKCGVPVVKRVQQYNSFGQQYQSQGFRAVRMGHGGDGDELESGSNSNEIQDRIGKSRQLSTGLKASQTLEVPLQRRWNAGRSEWTLREDARLQELCLRPGPHSWQNLAPCFSERSARSIETRWNKVIKPRLIQQVAAPHSERFEAIEEDEEVSAGIVFDSPVGRKMPLASLLQDSFAPSDSGTSNSRQLIRWTDDEDDLLRELVMAPRKTFRVNWENIASRFPGRSKAGVQSRWQGILSNRLKAIVEPIPQLYPPSTTSLPSPSVTPSSEGSEIEDCYPPGTRRCRTSPSLALSPTNFTLRDEHTAAVVSEEFPLRRATRAVLSDSYLNWRSGY